MTLLFSSQLETKIPMRLAKKKKMLVRHLTT